MVAPQLLFPPNLVSRQSRNGTYELDILKIFFEDSRVSEVKPPDDCLIRDEVAIVELVLTLKMGKECKQELELECNRSRRCKKGRGIFNDDQNYGTDAIGFSFTK